MRKMSVLVAGMVLAMTGICRAQTHVDVLVAYDTSASEWIGERDFTSWTFAEQQIARANEVLENSGLGGVFDFRLVGVHDGLFTHNAANGLSSTLLAATESNEASWTALRDDRKNTGADLVVVFVNVGETSAEKGLSNGLEPYVNGERKYGLDFPQARNYLEWFADQAYGIVGIAGAAESYTVAHELGHMMGAGHSELLSPNYSWPGPQLYAYSAAVMAQGSDGNYYATVMGYNATGYPDSARYTVLPYFSSPNLQNPVTGDALGDAEHDNVTTLRNTYAKVAAFRAEVAQDPDPEDPVAPTDPVDAAGAFTEKKLSINAAVRDGESIVGLAEFTVDQTKKGESKVSAMVIALNGKKMKAKNARYAVHRDDDGVSFVTLRDVAVKGFDGLLNVTIRSDGSVVDGTIGSLSLVSCAKGIESDSAYFCLSEPIETILGGEVVQSVEYDGQEYCMLPYAAAPEKVTIGQKWSVAKGGKIKLQKNRDTGESYLLPVGTGNFSALKLSYQAKTGAFKGSFTVYAIIGGKLKKFKFSVTGVAADGKGAGVAVCKKAGIALGVSVE